MFDVAVSEEVLKYAEAVLSEHNFGRRGVGDGNPKQQLTGLVGQVIVQDLFQYPRTDGRSGPDGGVDLVFHGLTIDVKTMGRKHRPRPEWVNNYTALQEHFPTNALVFTSLNWHMRELTVCGWTLKDLFLRTAKYYPSGTWRERGNGTRFRTEYDLFEMANRALYQPRSRQQLHDQLLEISIAEGRCYCESCLEMSGQDSDLRGLTRRIEDANIFQAAGRAV